MFNIFKKKSSDDENKKKVDDELKGIPGAENMGMLQRIAMKKVMKMNPKEREDLMRKALEPKNVQKNKKQILEMLEQMEKSGQMNKHQVFEAKKRMGLL
ncbi:MAG: hypothetical protein ACD_11C00024G0024 [uncultured bacterium]|nr:MAG: hypothetical protein ACD_11C00024G0024 [uncultured bacterium]HBR71946.1 hypothetical protein [Candidatus Moranbacteria bacterium]